MTLEVRPCDASQAYLHVLENASAAERFIEIAIPDNERAVRVAADNGAPVAAANVWSYVGTEEGDLGNTRSWGILSLPRFRAQVNG